MLNQEEIPKEISNFLNEIPQTLFEVRINFKKSIVKMTYLNESGKALFKKLFGSKVLTEGFDIKSSLANLEYIETINDFYENPEAIKEIKVQNREYLINTHKGKKILLQASMSIKREKNIILARGTVCEKSEIIEGEIPKVKSDYYKSIEEEVENLREFFDTFDALIMIINETGRVLFVSPNVGKDILYRPREEIIGRKITEIFPKGQADFFFQHFKEAFTTGEATNFEYHLPIENKVLWFQCRVIPVLVKDGKFTQVVAIIRDITKWRLGPISED